MTNQDDKELKTTLLDDDEFVKLMEEEIAQEGVEEDKLAKQRAWQRLEAQGVVPSPSKKAWLIPASAAAVLLAVALIPKLFGPGDDLMKSGGASGARTPALSLSQDARGLRLDLERIPGNTGHVALILESQPLRVLWQGPEQTWSEALTLSSNEGPRVCLVQAASAEALLKRTSLIMELQQLPEDASCVKLQ